MAEEIFDSHYLQNEPLQNQEEWHKFSPEQARILDEGRLLLYKVVRKNENPSILLDFLSDPDIDEFLTTPSEKFGGHTPMVFFRNRINQGEIPKNYIEPAANQPKFVQKVFEVEISHQPIPEATKSIGSTIETEQQEVAKAALQEPIQIKTKRDRSLPPETQDGYVVIRSTQDLGRLNENTTNIYLSLANLQTLMFLRTLLNDFKNIRSIKVPPGARLRLGRDRVTKFLEERDVKVKFEREKA